jgi:uracil-DNA glycosylase
MPDYAPFKQFFWYDWGPVFYRGRLDGSARVLCIASDPGPTERLVGRTLVGDAGQRVQGFLAKLGLTRSYLCFNAYALALIPSQDAGGDDVLDAQDHKAWRNTLYDMAKTAGMQAIIGFGVQAHRALAKWPGKGTMPVFNLLHPSSHDPAALTESWRAAIPQLRALVTPDADGDATLPNYGAQVVEADYRPIPKRDLPFGLPAFVGDDAWLRAQTPARFGSVSRPRPDDRHTLIWIAPTTS